MYTWHNKKHRTSVYFLKILSIHMAKTKCGQGNDSFRKGHPNISDIKQYFFRIQGAIWVPSGILMQIRLFETAPVAASKSCGHHTRMDNAKRVIEQWKSTAKGPLEQSSSWQDGYSRPESLHAEFWHWMDAPRWQFYNRCLVCSCG